MKISFLILLCKLITKVCNIFKFNGSVFPASIVRKFDKDILTKIKYPKYVIGITGSSGKDSTTLEVAHILGVNNYKVVWNKSGSNVVNGTTTLILNNTGIFSHRVNADVLLLEMDESYIKETFNKCTLTHLVVTNITRDQPSRNIEPDVILNKINDSLSEDINLIVNGDDPLVLKLASGFKNVKTYGIGKTKYSLDKPVSNNVDALYCPLCNSKLKFKYYHYGHLGNYYCKCKKFKRLADYEAFDVDLDKKLMVINGNSYILNKGVLFCAYYTLAAYALCMELGLSNEEILGAVNNVKLESKRLRELSFNGRCVEMLESKNENNLSYLQSLNYINLYKDVKSIILGFDNVSRRYKYNDISWLYDVDFEILDTSNIDKIYCIGRFRYDVYARLRLANIDADKLILVDNIKDITDKLSLSKGKIFTMVCFDMTGILKKLFMEGEDD